MSQIVKEGNVSELEREKFDKWVRENAIDSTRLPHGGYRSMVTHFAWKAWKQHLGKITDLEKRVRDLEEETACLEDLNGYQNTG
jgi:hypothetical protein